MERGNSPNTIGAARSGARRHQYSVVLFIGSVLWGAHIVSRESEFRAGLQSPMDAKGQCRAYILSLGSSFGDWESCIHWSPVASLGILTCAEFRNRKEWQLNWHQRSHRCWRAPERAACALRSAQASESVFSSSSLAPRRGWCCYRLDLCSDVVLLLLLQLLLLLPLPLPPAPTMNPLHDLLWGYHESFTWRVTWVVSWLPPPPWIFYMTCYVGCFVATPFTMNPWHDLLRGLFRGYPLWTHIEADIWSNIYTIEHPKSMENEIKTGLPILNIYCGTNQFLTKVAEFVFFKGNQKL